MNKKKKLRNNLKKKSKIIQTEETKFLFNKIVKKKLYGKIQ